MSTKWKKALMGLVLLDFAAFTGYVLYTYGLAGFGKLAFANAATIQITIDLVFALLLATGWMIKDARDRGVSATPYILLTCGLGSMGPMLYYIMRKEAPKEAAQTTKKAMGIGATATLAG